MIILKAGSEGRQETKKDGWGAKMEINKGSERAEGMVLTACIKTDFAL